MHAPRILKPLARLFQLGALCVLVASAAAAQEKPTIPPTEYGRFEQLGAPALSPRGDWIAYPITRVDETRELRIRPLARDTTIVVEHAATPSFGNDNLHVAWSVGVPPDEQRRLERERKPVHLKAAVRNLTTGAERSFDDVRAFGFDATGRFLALHGYAPDEPKGKGADLRLVDLQSGQELTFGNVAEYAWSDVGSHLALAVATGTAASNGVQVYDARAARLRPLHASSSSYRHLAWRKDALDLAALRSLRPVGEDSTVQVLLAWRGLDRDARLLELDAAAAGVPDTLGVSPHTPPRWSDDGARISFGLRPAPADRASPGPAAPDSTPARPDTARTEVADSAAERPAANDEPELPSLQIWHTSDVRLMAEQKVRATADGRRPLLAVWTPASNRVVQIGTDPDENASVLGSWRHGIEKIAAPHAWGTMFGRRYHDVWLVDLENGTRTLALERVRYSLESPDGRYLLAFDGGDFWTYDVRTGRRANITAQLGAVFADTAYDTPTDLLPPQGVGGWTADDAAVLLYDEYDVWLVAPDGSRGERLTRGREDELIHRLVRLDRSVDHYDDRAPLYLSLRGRWTQQSGYARLRPGRPPQRLLLLDRAVGGLMRADSADVFLFRMQARDVSPDLHAAGADLADARQVTRTNPFAADYAWGRSELIEFRSETGRRLQGTLLYPANYDATRQYPMIVYAYEILSPGTHTFQAPSERSYYNFTAWSQHGYFVLLPDIVFRARDPGVSLVEAIRPAVRSIVERGLVDARRVGFVGHSWGGYHATYLATHTDIFAAAVAGAPLTDFVSFMGQIHWNTGTAETDHWETGQARMEVPYWEDPEAHHRNSPLHRVHEMTTPLLMAHGDKDGVVEFFQATLFYNFARRAGKQMVLLVYEDENHSFTKQPNQIDYHRRILEWFGHYLRDKPAPAWITDGVRYDRMLEEKKRVAAPD